MIAKRSVLGHRQPHNTNEPGGREKQPKRKNKKEAASANKDPREQSGGLYSYKCLFLRLKCDGEDYLNDLPTTTTAHGENKDDQPGIQTLSEYRSTLILPGLARTGERHARRVKTYIATGGFRCFPREGRGKVHPGQLRVYILVLIVFKTPLLTAFICYES